jgi:hypothetical protein
MMPSSVVEADLDVHSSPLKRSSSSEGACPRHAPIRNSCGPSDCRCRRGRGNSKERSCTVLACAGLPLCPSVRFDQAQFLVYNINSTPPYRAISKNYLSYSFFVPEDHVGDILVRVKVPTKKKTFAEWTCCIGYKRVVCAPSCRVNRQGLGVPT